MATMVRRQDFFTGIAVRVDGRTVPLALPEGTRSCCFTVRFRKGRRIVTVWLAVHRRRVGTPDFVVQLPNDLRGLRVHVHRGGACLHCVEPTHDVPDKGGKEA